LNWLPEEAQIALYKRLLKNPFKIKLRLGSASKVIKID